MSQWISVNRSVVRAWEARTAEKRSQKMTRGQRRVSTSEGPLENEGPFATGCVSLRRRGPPGGGYFSRFSTYRWALLSLVDSNLVGRLAPPSGVT